MPGSRGEWAASLGLLVLRLGAAGLLLYGHGWAKVVNFADRADRFADPLGVGSTASLALVVLAEVFCAAFVLLGFATRIMVLPILGFLFVAAFVHHAADPFARKELALVYIVPFLALAFTGPGRFSLDAAIGWMGERKPR